jgi:hypothetical protein
LVPCLHVRSPILVRMSFPILCPFLLAYFHLSISILGIVCFML